MKEEVKEEEGFDLKSYGVAHVKSEMVVVPVKRELPDSDTSFSARLPLWIKMCTDFQKHKRTWAPSRPCCLPNWFLDKPVAPCRVEGKACYHRLDKAAPLTCIGNL